jgi:methyl-accepting chemotaxis protein
MKLFFAPLVRLLSGTRIRGHLYCIGVLALAPLLILLWLIGAGENAAITPAIRGSAMAVAVASLLLAAYLMGAMVLRVSPDIRRLASAIKRIGSGDLTARIDHAETFEGARMGEYIARSNQHLIDIVAQVRTSSDAVLSGAKEIAMGNQQLSQRTEAQASTLEQTAARLEELAASAKQNADNCRRADTLVTQTDSTASASAGEVQALIASMENIVTSSRRIEEIVAVIDGIAFQTNLLALNAAVEAARAGEQGRGFAVVASEVRNLAQRTSVAAKEIKTLIGDAVDQVNGGTKLVGNVATSMQAVVHRVREVNGLIGAIAESSRDQSDSIDEVNRGIAQLEHASQQNAALVQQAHSVTSGFEGEAIRLSEVVDKFKLDRMAAREQAVALVESAAAHLIAKGPERAYRDFERPNSAFMFADYYVYAFDMKGDVFVHPTLKGKNALDLADSDGKQFVRPMIVTGKTTGKGWEDYRWLNPITQKIEQKSAYFQRVGEVILACGIYKGDVAHAPTIAAPAPLRLVARV